MRETVAVHRNVDRSVSGHAFVPTLIQDSRDPSRAVLATDAGNGVDIILMSLHRFCQALCLTVTYRDRAARNGRIAVLVLVARVVGRLVIRLSPATQNITPGTTRVEASTASIDTHECVRADKRTTIVADLEFIFPARIHEAGRIRRRVYV